MARGAVTLDPDRLPNPKREEFCQRFLVHLNATQAAREAGYSAKTARAQGCRLMGFAEVQARIQQLMERRASRTEITQDRVIQELALLAFSDMWAFATWGDGRVKLTDSATLTEDATRCVAEVSESDKGALRFRLHDKVGALTKLGQHLGMFVEKHEHTGRDGGPIQHAQVSLYMPENGRDARA